MGDTLIGNSSASSASSRISGSEDTLHDSASGFDNASSFRTTDADGSVHEADAGTNICGAKDGSLETQLRPR